MNNTVSIVISLSNDSNKIISNWNLKDFIEEIFKLLEKNGYRYGPEEYKKLWGVEFPFKEYKKL